MRFVHNSKQRTVVHISDDDDDDDDSLILEGNTSPEYRSNDILKEKPKEDDEKGHQHHNNNDNIGWGSLKPLKTSNNDDENDDGILRKSGGKRKSPFITRIMTTKKKTKTKTKAISSSSDSEYIKCPMCNLRVRMANINTHIDLICSSNDNTTKKKKKKNKKKKKETVNENNSKRKRMKTVQTSSSSSTTTRILVCPVCNLSVPKSLMNDHIDTCSQAKSSSSSSSSNNEKTDGNLLSLSSNFFTDGPRPSSAFMTSTKKSRKKKPPPNVIGEETLEYCTKNCINDDNDRFCGCECSSSLCVFKHVSWKWSNENVCDSDEKDSNIYHEFMLVRDYGYNNNNNDGVIKLHLGHNMNAFSHETFNFDTWKNDMLKHTRNPHRYRFSASLLKSLMQKNIRQSRAMAAVRTGIQLIVVVGFVDFLRRLTVTILEDCILHPLYPYLIWLLGVCSKKGYEPSVTQVNICLSILHDVASVRVRDCLPNELSSSERSSIPVSSLNNEEIMPPSVEIDEEFPILKTSSKDEWCVLLPFINDKLLPCKYRDYIRSLMLRACFGGLKGDVAMLNAFALFWCQRLTSTNATKWMKYIHYVYAKVHKYIDIMDKNGDYYMNDDDIILSAVDHHCSSIISTLAKSQRFDTTRKKLRNYINSNYRANFNNVNLQEILPNIIWKKRSSLTTKHCLHTYYKEMKNQYDQHVVDYIMNKTTHEDNDDGGDDDDDDMHVQALYTMLEEDIDDFAMSFISQRCETVN